MNCPACGAQWTLPANSRKTSDTCPFCGASLLPAAPAASLEEALRKILALSGPQGLRNGGMLLSCFADLAPELQKERLLLSYLVHKGTHLKLLEAPGESPAQQQLIYNRAVHTLHQEQFIVREAAELVCAGFLAALGVTVSRQTQEAKPSRQAEPGKADVQKDLVSVLSAAAKAPVKTGSAGKIPRAADAAPYVPNAPIHCHEHYMKALRDLFLQNGRRRLNNAQILRFLWSNQLDTRFGITLEDAKADLHTIAPSIF